MKKELSKQEFKQWTRNIVTIAEKHIAQVEREGHACDAIFELISQHDPVLANMVREADHVKAKAFAKIIKYVKNRTEN